MKKVRWGFLIGVSSSLGIHAGLILVVPPPAPDAVPRQEYHVVDLRRIEIPLPELPPLPKEEPEKTPDLGRPPLFPPSDEKSPQVAGLGLENMALAARLPDVKAPLPPPSTIVISDPVESTPLIPPERIGRGDRPRGIPYGTRPRGKLKLLTPLSGMEAAVSSRLRDLRSRWIREELRKVSRAKPTNEEIQGPVAARELVFRPPPPRAPAGAEGEIELKFWVLPDGTVGRIILLRRGNLTLETAVIQNLKQWKFNSLPPDADIPEQWGILRFRFLSAAAKTPPSPGQR